MGGKTGTTTQSVTIPPEVLARYNRANEMAEKAAGQPFQKYTGQFVAPLTATQQQGMAATQAASNMAQPYYQQAQQAINNAYGQATPMYGQSLATMQGGIGQAMGQYGEALQGISGARDIGTQYADSARQGFQGAKGSAQPYMQQAADLFGSALGQSNPLLSQAEGYLGGATKSVSPTEFSGAEISKYMSPYQKQVIDAQQALQAQEAAQQRSALSTQAIGSGAFGGDRAGVAQANLARQQSLANQATMANILQQGYGQASQMFQQQQAVNMAADQANRTAQQFGSQQSAALGAQRFGQNLAAGQQQMGLGQALFGQDTATGQAMAGLGQQQYAQGLGAAQAQAGIGQNIFGMGAQQAALQQAAAQGLYGMGKSQADTFAALGTGKQAAALQGAQATLAAGTLEQQTQQAQDTAKYQEFLQERGYPFQIAQFLANIATGTGAVSGQTTTTVQPIPALSDRRVKEDIKQVGETNDGQPIYRFKYKGDEQTQLGLIAQDVEKEHPEAVGSIMGGIKTVDYKKATDDAVERADGGGVYPNSMGGVVSPLSAGESFERGGYAFGGGPGDLAPTDIQAILASQRESFGPFGQSGLYGGSAQGPLYGGKGVVPPPRMHRASLRSAGPIPRAPDSDLKSAYSGFKDVSNVVKDFTGKGLETRAGEALGFKSASKSPPKEKPLTVSPVEGQPGTGVVPAKIDIAAPEVALDKDPSMLDSIKEGLSSLFRADGGGVMPRGHYSIGGKGSSSNPYELTEDPMTDVIADQEGDKKEEMLKPGAVPPTPKGWLSEILDAGKTVASIAAPFMASDERIKKNKEQIGKLYDGQPVYRYDFGDGRTQLGLMAQDVERRNPEAVATHNSGVKMVNYDRATDDAAKRGKFAMGGVMPREGYDVGGPIDPAESPTVSAQEVRAPSVERQENPIAPLLRRTAEKVGVDPVDLGTAISYETAGTFDPWKRGPTTKWGEHRGWIQWGEPQRAQYGVTRDSTPEQQMDAVGRYLVDRGVKPGMGLKDIYSAINAGSVGRYNASDEQAGGAPGTVADKVAGMGDHRAKAARLLGIDLGDAPPRPPGDIPESRAQGVKPQGGATAEASSDGRGIKGFWKDNQGTILPILAGLGAAADSRSLTLGGALLSGLGAGARSYTDINRGLADLDIERAKLPGVAMDSAFKAIQTDSQGRTSVFVPGKGIIPLAEWRSMGSPTLGGSKEADAIIAQLARIVESGGSIPTSIGQQTTAPKAPSDAPAATPGAGTEEKAERPAGYAYKIDISPTAKQVAKAEADALIGLPAIERASQIQQNAEMQKNVERSAQSSLAYSKDLSELSKSLVTLSQNKDWATTGAAAPLRFNVINIMNTLASGANLDPKYQIKGGADAQIADKVKTILSGQAAGGLDQRAASALESLAKGVPDKSMDANAIQELLAQMYVNKQRAIDENTYVKKYARSQAGNTIVGRDAREQFGSEFNERRYLDDKAVVKNILGQTIGSTKEPLLNYILGQGQDKALQKRLTPDVIDKTYGPGVSRYFLSTTY